MSEANHKPAPQLAPGLDNLAAFEQFNAKYQARIEKGVTKDDILKQEYWAHHAKRLRVFDEIRAIAADGTWLANLIVLDCSVNWARVQLLSFHELTGRPEGAKGDDITALLDRYEVLHRGPRKWSVVRKDDRAVMKEDMTSKDEAETWLKDNVRTMSVPVAA